MIVLMIAAEFSPYTEAGPAATTVAALSRALAQLGHEVTVVLPKCPGYEEKGLLVARRLSPLELQEGGTATVFDGQLGSGVKLVLIDAPQFFERPQVYGEGASDGPNSGDYPDNAERFGFFAQAVTAFVQQRQQQGNPYDLIHAHDWPGALAVMQLKTSQPALPCLLTVHDSGRSGRFALEAAAALHIPARFADAEGVHMAGALSVLKGGVLAADALTVAAPSLVTDLADESRHGPLAVAFARRAAATTGILAGLDYAVYNPATDAELASRFDAEHLDAKRICRTAVLRDAGLDLDGDRPLLVCMNQAGSGFDAVRLKTLCGELLSNDLNLIVAGDGALQLDPLPQSELGKAALISKSGAAMERKLYAAADLVLCLAPYPGDGLSIRKAQRYAAVPIAQSQGAALDTIVDCDAQLETGTGFLFENPADVEATVQRALVAYRSDAWPRLQRRVARLDLSWDRVAHRYQKLYRQLQKQ